MGCAHLISFIFKVHLHPSILPEDFDITPGGQLILNLPPGGDEIEPYQNGYEGESGEQTGESEREGEHEPETASHATTTSTLVADTGDTQSRYLYDEAFKKIIEEAAQGRAVSMIQLCKPEGRSLGFSVVGLRSEHKGELGIYVQEIQEQGIAGQDGRLVEGDQILAIDGQVTTKSRLKPFNPF